jgi:peroxiredoxin
MPSVQRAHIDFRNTDIVVLAISIDVEGSQVVKPFLVEHDYTMPVLLDSKLDLFYRLGLKGTPGTFVVNRHGYITAKGFGPVDFDNATFREYVTGVAAV